ncbi:enoyl-CoA hydratase-related protein [Mycolicibacterium sp.]|uniref:enoyl-CoA hydratase/isomerase family protein n=1 Tax=Mycolicibacterium sp. TaxID=2320850 RepID=UPI001A18D027|nr:enoyl-CoA hydratase-related protein [Mycolicibacterium sp.]MBJ7336760.1 enoyl-CoA hydratase/isomerase family protein [Mycolicibacterium sp.]
MRIITINRPKSKNALDIPMRAQLTALTSASHGDPEIRAVVITGAGGTFCSGADVTAMEQQTDPVKARARVETAQQIARSIGGGSTPVIAAVEGVAFGAGLAIALACDYIVATPEVRLSAAFVNVGLSGDAGILFSLPQRVGPARARTMLMMGQTIEGTEALRIGLVDELTAPGDALDKATAVATSLAARPPLAIAAIKGAFAALPISLEAALETEVRLQAPLLGSNDFQEAISAFKEKRKPTFTGA